MIAPSIRYVNTYLRGGMDDSSTGAVADKRSTITHTDADTDELTPAFLLLDDTRLALEAVLQVYPVYLGFVAFIADA